MLSTSEPGVVSLLLADLRKMSLRAVGWGGPVLGRKGPDIMRSVLGTLVHRLRPLAAVTALSLAGLAGTTVQARAFDIPNPYASGPDDADVTIRKLTAFGDSFTRKKRRPFHNWAEQLLYEDGEVAALAGFAVSGATGGNVRGLHQRFRPSGHEVAQHEHRLARA